MAATQSINCIKCGKVLGTLDCTSGDFHAIHFITAAQEEDKKPSSRVDFNQAIEAKNKYRKQRDPQGNLNKAGMNVTCSCGRVSKVI